METFEISLERIRSCRLETLRLLDSLAFLSSGNQQIDFRSFLGFERPWLGDLRPSLPDYEVFALGLADQSEYLAELENVSLGVRSQSKKPLTIHSLWLECIQQRAGNSNRIRWLRQILLLCHGSIARKEIDDYNKMRPFVANALSIANRFQVSLDDLFDAGEIRDWLDVMTEEEPENPFIESEDSESVSSAAETLPEQSQEDQSLTRNGVDQDFSLNKMIALHQSCHKAARSFSSVNVSKMSETAFTSIRTQFIQLLRRLRMLEDESKSEDLALPSYKVRQREVYDQLIGMAAIFQNKDPLVAEQLRLRRKELED